MCTANVICIPHMHGQKADANRTGAAASMEHRRRERLAARYSFERMKKMHPRLRYGAVILRLIPLLIQRLQYSEDELADLPVEDEVDEHEPDSAEEVRPYVYKVKNDEDEPERGPVRAAVPAGYLSFGPIEKILCFL